MYDIMERQATFLWSYWTAASKVKHVSSNVLVRVRLWRKGTIWENCRFSRRQITQPPSEFACLMNFKSLQTVFRSSVRAAAPWTGADRGGPSVYYAKQCIIVHGPRVWLTADYWNYAAGIPQQPLEALPSVIPINSPRYHTAIISLKFILAKANVIMDELLKR